MTVEGESETCTLAGCEMEKGGHRQRNVVASRSWERQSDRLS